MYIYIHTQYIYTHIEPVKWGYKPANIRGGHYLMVPGTCQATVKARAKAGKKSQLLGCAPGGSGSYLYLYI